MAYNYYPQFYPQMQNYNYNSQNLQPQVQQTQNNGLVSAPNEDFARNYPVAYGNSITFKDENAPYVYTKTMGYSQLEPPKFERYRLVKEDAVEQTEDKPKEKVTFAEQSEVDALRDEADALRSEIKTLRTDVNKLMSVKKVKKEVIIEEDDAD